MVPRYGVRFSLRTQFLRFVMLYYIMLAPPTLIKRHLSYLLKVVTNQKLLTTLGKPPERLF